jgi:RimJ/RimL family protein N-acetyltransferase
MRSAPRLETERVVVRAWGAGDFARYHAIVSEPATTRHFGGKPMGREECWRRICAMHGQWGLIGIGGWAVERKSDGVLIGSVSLFNAWRDLQPEFGTAPEFGYIFTSAVHGQGYASEACCAVLEWADSSLHPTPIWAIIAPANAPSLHLAGKLGFRHHSETSYGGEPTLVLRREASAA